VSSEVGKGSVFSFALPALAPGASAQRHTRPLSLESEPGRGRTILLVDDDEDLRELVGGELERLGYYVLHAQNGRIALDLLSRMNPRPDAVLLDIAMPVMSGTEVLETLASQGLTPALPVVVVSGHATDAKTARRVLRKPVPIELLLQVVEEVSRPRPAPEKARLD
jgi:two-component system NtrC family sensor kinase